MQAGILTRSYWSPDTTEPILDTTVGGVLREAAARAADRPALIEGVPDRQARRHWSYGKLLEQAERAARALLSRFTPGERIAVWANNIPEWIVLEFGAALAGLTLVTINPAYRKRELSYVLKQSRAHGIFLVPEYRGSPMAAMVEELRPELPELREVVLFSDWAAFCATGSITERLPEVRPEDPVQIQYTSGTTGFPKGAVLHHRGITNNARLTARSWASAEGNVWVNPMPLFHTGGCVLSTLGPVQSLGTQVLMPYFDPALQLELVESERAATLFGVPTMLIAMLEHPDFTTRDLSSVRVAGSGGSTVPPDVVHHIEASLGVPFSIVFGQTESSPVITQVRLDDSPEDRATSLGRALPQTEVKIVDPSTQEVVPSGTIGELCTRGYLVMQGYFENPEATAAAIDAEGWLHTGDLCSMDERGYCRIAGRLKEMIIRGGENIYPREIEQVLFSHPAVGDVAVVGVPDPKWGEQVAAFIRPATGHEPRVEELRAFCREHLSPHKTPVYWEFVDQFPLTASGKVQKFVLREQLVTGKVAV
jgi:acyl-CoA synthetase (AMP-forming)/AMP-acid ligase II